MSKRKHRKVGLGTVDTWHKNGDGIVVHTTTHKLPRRLHYVQAIDKDGGMLLLAALIESIDDKELGERIAALLDYANTEYDTHGYELDKVFQVKRPLFYTSDTQVEGVLICQGSGEEDIVWEEHDKEVVDDTAE